MLIMWIKHHVSVDNVENPVETEYNRLLFVVIFVDNKKDWQ
jgi:hypothetical protein